MDRLRELGVSQRGLQMERDGWILMQSVSPKEAAIWMADKRQALMDPEFRAIYLETDAAFDWSPDDTRLYALADRSQRWMASWAGKSKREEKAIPDPTIVKLVATSARPVSPAWDRLTQITRERMAEG
jgi:hypothetical protein